MIEELSGTESTESFSHKGTLPVYYLSEVAQFYPTVQPSFNQLNIPGTILTVPFQTLKKSHVHNIQVL